MSAWDGKDRREGGMWEERRARIDQFQEQWEAELKRRTIVEDGKPKTQSAAGRVRGKGASKSRTPQRNAHR